MKKHFQDGLKVAVSVLGIAAVVWMFRGKWPEVALILKKMNLPLFLLAFFFYLVGIVIISFRLQFLLKVQRVLLPWAQVLYFNVIGQFFSLFLPSSIGGDVVKGYYLYKKTGKKTASFVSIFLDRLVGSMAILCFAFFSLFYIGHTKNLSGLGYGIAVIFLAMIFAMLFFLDKRIARRFRFFYDLIPSVRFKDFLAHLYHRLNYYQHHKMVLAKGFLISVVAQMLFISVYFMVSKSLLLDIPYHVFFLVIPIVSAMSITPSINGLGVREAGMVYLMGWFTSSENALALSLMMDALIYGTGLLSGLVYFAKEGFQTKVIRDAVKIEQEIEEKEIKHDR